jgi:hypothetical protein
MQANTITFTDSELHAVLINHTRYCLARRSYAVAECADLLKSKWSQIPVNTQTIIRRDIEEAIRDDDQTIKRRDDKLAGADSITSCYFSMDKCDRSSWDSLLDFIKKKLPQVDPAKTINYMTRYG